MIIYSIKCEKKWRKATEQEYGGDPKRCIAHNCAVGGVCVYHNLCIMKTRDDSVADLEG